MHEIYEQLTNASLWVCTVLVVVIPWGVNKINELLHKYGDPPWKKPGGDPHSKS